MPSDIDVNTSTDQTDVSPNAQRARRLKSLAFLPTIITLGNLTCGFAAIYFGMRAVSIIGTPNGTDMSTPLHGEMLERMIPSFLSLGAGLVILGMIFDCFDGLVARATRTTTNFGGQLDSLADVVTCGVAPAILIIAFMTKELSGDSILPSPISEHILGRITWVSAAVYVMFAAIRLARYNVEHEQADFDHRSFRGLPSPGAAAIMVSLVLLQDQLGDNWRTLIAYSMPVFALTTAYLMVSRIPYKRFYRAYLLGRQPFGQTVTIVLVIALCFTFKTPALVMLVLWYGASGPVFLLVRKLRDRKRAKSTIDQTDSPELKIRRGA